MPKKKKQKKNDFFYREMTPALLPALIMATHFYGSRALLLCLISTLGALVCELVGCKITKQPTRITDCSSIYIGLLLALMLPASSPWWLPLVGAAFAVLLVKVPFGGVRGVPFSCTAAAFAFLSICCPKETFAYPVVETAPATQIFGTEQFTPGVSLAQSLLQNRTHSVTGVELINSFIGSIPGPMGMTSAVLLFGILIYVLVRRRKSFINALSFLLTCLVYCVGSVAFDVGGLLTERAFRMICVRLFSGFTLCIAVFLITEEPMSPKKTLHRVLYGVTAGVGYIILRRFSVFEDAGCFAVLAANALWPAAERLLFTRKKSPEPEVTRSE